MNEDFLQLKREYDSCQTPQSYDELNSYTSVTFSPHHFTIRINTCIT